MVSKTGSLNPEEKNSNIAIAIPATNLIVLCVFVVFILSYIQVAIISNKVRQMIVDKYKIDIRTENAPQLIICSSGLFLVKKSLSNSTGIITERYTHYSLGIRSGDFLVFGKLPPPFQGHEKS